MFGLMRPQNSCSHKTTNAYRHHRMHYCGTCKTLGQSYGQRARVLLNFDTVFFAELLSHLSNENLAGWQVPYQAINRCFTMPDRKKEIPLPLEYAAAANVILGELKMDDHNKDLPGIKWKLIRQFFSKPFRKADRQMQAWGIDTQSLWQWIEQQSKIEKMASTNFHSLPDLLDHYAEPTAQMTGLVFSEGASVIGQPEHKENLFSLGYQFGRLAYALDAFEDIEKDLFRQQFNPLALFFQAQRTLQEDQLAQVRQVLLGYQETVAKQLKTLPFNEEVVERYTVRLYSNIALRLYRERHIPKTQKEQIGNIWENAVTNTMHAIGSTATWLRSANYYMVSLVVFLIPLAADYVGFASKGLVYKRAAILTSILAAIGLGRLAWAQRKKRKAKRNKRKGKGRIRRFFRQLPLLLTKKNPCAEECSSVCCQACCEILCESVCEGDCCNSESGEKATVVVVVLLLILIIVAMILILV